MPLFDSSTTNRLFTGFLWSIAIMIAILVIGTAGYHVIGGDKYTLLDCF